MKYKKIALILLFIGCTTMVSAQQHRNDADRVKQSQLLFDEEIAGLCDDIWNLKEEIKVLYKKYEDLLAKKEGTPDDKNSYNAVNPPIENDESSHNDFDYDGVQPDTEDSSNRDKDNSKDVNTEETGKY